MRVYTRYLFFVFLGIMFSTRAYCDSIKSIKCGWLSISDSAQKMIVQDYVNALDSFALAMPIVGGDAESTWAADTVHVMAKRVKEGQRAFLESMSEIYQMQNYIAYGMSCDTGTGDTMYV